jgi:hypothetical protein
MAFRDPRMLWTVDPRNFDIGNITVLLFAFLFFFTFSFSFLFTHVVNCIFYI